MSAVNMAYGCEYSCKCAVNMMIKYFSEYSAVSVGLMMNQKCILPLRSGATYQFGRIMLYLKDKAGIILYFPVKRQKATI